MPWDRRLQCPRGKQRTLGGFSLQDTVSEHGTPWVFRSQRTWVAQWRPEVSGCNARWSSKGCLGTSVGHALGSLNGCPKSQVAMHGGASSGHFGTSVCKAPGSRSGCPEFQFVRHVGQAVGTLGPRWAKHLGHTVDARTFSLQRTVDEQWAPWDPDLQCTWVAQRMPEVPVCNA